jgi:hypothetical protein
VSGPRGRGCRPACLRARVSLITSSRRPPTAAPPLRTRRREVHGQEAVVLGAPRLVVDAVEHAAELVAVLRQDGLEGGEGDGRDGCRSNMDGKAAGGGRGARPARPRVSGCRAAPSARPHASPPHLRAHAKLGGKDLSRVGGADGGGAVAEHDRAAQQAAVVCAWREAGARGVEHVVGLRHAAGVEADLGQQRGRHPALERLGGCVWRERQGHAHGQRGAVRHAGQRWRQPQRGPGGRCRVPAPPPSPPTHHVVDRKDAARPRQAAAPILLGQQRRLCTAGGASQREVPSVARRSTGRGTQREAAAPPPAASRPPPAQLTTAADCQSWRWMQSGCLPDTSNHSSAAREKNMKRSRSSLAP